MNEPFQRGLVHHFSPGKSAQVQERVLLRERPLTISLASGEELALMRTPGADRELVVGFLLTEGFISGLDEIGALEVCEDAPDRVRVSLVNPAPESAARRRMLITSACGLCGRERIEALFDELRPVAEGPSFPVRVLFDLPDRMRREQHLFERTGASHAAALFDPDGRLLILREDIGRHNALDRVIGAALLTGRSFSGCGVFLSGRASFEMVVKSARVGLPLVAAVSAASALAVEAAHRWNITLCGFVRRSEVTCYAHPERLME